MMPFRYIKAWGFLQGHSDARVEANVRRATAEEAPEDACFYDSNQKKWTTEGQLDPEARRVLSMLVSSHESA